MIHRGLLLFFSLFLALLIAGAFGSHETRFSIAPADVLAQPAQKYEDEGKKIVPYVPTPQEVVERMLEEVRAKGLAAPGAGREP